MIINSPEGARSAGIPVVECQWQAQRPGWACDIWIVSKCPHCGQRHVHGAGEGLRSSHCSEVSSGSYYLVEKARFEK